MTAPQPEFKDVAERNLVFRLPAELLSPFEREPCGGFASALVAGLGVVFQRYTEEDSLEVQVSLGSENAAARIEAQPTRLAFSRAVRFSNLMQQVQENLLLGADNGWNPANNREVNRVHVSIFPESAGRAVVSFEKNDNGIDAAVRCRSGLFDENAASSMVEHLKAALASAARNPNGPITEIALVSDIERQRIVVDWNVSDRTSIDQCAHEIFEHQAQAKPHQTALIKDGHKMTYDDLRRNSNRLAQYLRQRQVGPETRVGICIDEPVRAIVAILGILKAGGAYVPLDPEYPMVRLREMAGQCGLSLAITTGRLKSRIPSGIAVLDLDLEAGAIALQSDQSIQSGTTPDNAAYVLFTSGSTGKPKGIVGLHRSITNSLLAVMYDPDERCCLNASLNYAFSVANLFLPLMRGLPLVVFSDEQRKDLLEFINILEKESITRIVVLTQIFHQILEMGPAIAARLRKVRSVGVSGAIVTEGLLKRFSELMPQAALHNGYASSEIGTLATIWNVTESPLTCTNVLVGRPIANTRIYILDGYMNPVPTGMTGELYVGAPHLARGYVGQPALTGERFVPDPFASQPGTRMFRTGDLGRWRPTGDIEFLGRADEQVKIRGFRIELAEIERALMNHAAVKQVLVLPHQANGVKRLVAYILTARPKRPMVGELRNHLKQSLPDFMIPAAFVLLDKFPLLPSGKIDAQALPAPGSIRPQLGTPFESPRNVVETTLAEIWSEVFNIEPIGIHDNFFELGGDSLLAIKVVSGIANAFSLEISLAFFFDRPTIAQLSAALSKEFNLAN
jgi:amino acid adenylation domain-containing protein